MGMGLQATAQISTAMPAEPAVATSTTSASFITVTSSSTGSQHNLVNTSQEDRSPSAASTDTSNSAARSSASGVSLIAMAIQRQRLNPTATEHQDEPDHVPIDWTNYWATQAEFFNAELTIAEARSSQRSMKVKLRSPRRLLSDNHHHRHHRHSSTSPHLQSL